MVKIYGLYPDPAKVTGRREKAGEQAEKEVWDLLEKTEETGAKAIRGFTGFSVQGQASAETDFIVWLSTGVFVLEVKSKHNPNRKSGWDQAKDNAHGLKHKLYEIVGCSKDDKSLRPAIHWGVVYTEHDTPELQQLSGAVSDINCLRSSEILENPEDFLEWMRSRIEGAQGSYSSNKKHWTHDEIEEYSEKMAGVKRLKKCLRAIDRRIEMFTDEQLAVYYDTLDTHQNQIIRGGAGTGKTVVALVLAQKLAETQKVLLLTSTSLQKDFLGSKISEFKDNISVMTVEQLELREREGFGPWDVAIVDEGQDLLSEDWIDLIDRVLEGGLESGRWYWFMDLANQSGIYGEASNDAFQLLESFLSSRKPMELKRNLRNTKNTADYVKEQLNAKVGKGSKILGDKVDFNWAKSNTSYTRDCADWITAQLNKFADSFADKVLIIDVSRSSSGMENDDWFFFKSVKPLLERSVKRKIKVHNHQTFQSENSNTLVTNPQRIKGLECAHCLVIGNPDLNENSEDDRRFIVSGMYVAMTRARHSVSFFLPKEWENINFEKTGESDE